MNSVFFIKIHVKVFYIQVNKNHDLKKKTLYRKKHAKIIESHIVHT